MGARAKGGGVGLGVVPTELGIGVECAGRVLFLALSRKLGLSVRRRVGGCLAGSRWTCFCGLFGLGVFGWGVWCEGRVSGFGRGAESGVLDVGGSWRCALCEGLQGGLSVYVCRGKLYRCLEGFTDFFLERSTAS